VARVLVWIQTWLGPPGIFVVALLDSSFLSLPEVTDLLVVTSGMQSGRAAWTAALMATLGTVAGCLVLWWLGRRGGEQLLVRRFGKARLDRTRTAFDRWDILALAGPAVAPPPMPFKAFVLAAGVFQIPLRRLAVTVFAARALRYSFWVVMSLLYHERALVFLEAVDRWCMGRAGVTLLAGLAVTLILVLLVLRRRTAAREAADDAVV